MQGEHRSRHGRRACTTGAAEDLAGDEGCQRSRALVPQVPPQSAPSWFFAGSVITPISQMHYRTPERGNEWEGAQGKRTCPPTPVTLSFTHPPRCPR